MLAPLSNRKEKAHPPQVNPVTIRRITLGFPFFTTPPSHTIQTPTDLNKKSAYATTQARGT